MLHSSNRGLFNPPYDDGSTSTRAQNGLVLLLHATCCCCPRFIAGAFTGQSVAGKSLVSEVCGEEHEVVGMSILASEWGKCDR